MDFNVKKYLSNLSYINKDFPSLWEEILETVPKLTNKWLPSQANESYPLVVLLKELAIVADKLNYNIDKNILELFPATLTQLRSAYNVYESLGYTPDWYVSASTDITIAYSGLVNGELPESYKSGVQTSSSEDPITEDGSTKVEDITCKIPRFTQVCDDNAEVIYTLMQDVVGENGSGYENGFTVGIPARLTVPAMEGTLNDFEINGSRQITYANLDSQNRLYFAQNNVAQNGIFISENENFSDFVYNPPEIDVDDEETSSWRRVDNLNQYVAGNKIYKLGIDSVNNSVYIQFPDDIGDLIQGGIYIKYLVSAGAQGNVGRGDISKFPDGATFTANDGSTTLDADDFTVMNTKSVQNGADPLDIEEMREQFSRVVGVFNTLVTCRDYENYIYEATEPDGSHYVSNIRVSDRYNDLYNSVTYKQMNMTGEITDETATLTPSDNSSGKVMSAYDLRLYPLPAQDSIETLSELLHTFGTGADSASASDSLDDTLTNLNRTIIQDVIPGAKTISHDFVDPGYPVLINYNLTGQIYLQSSVSEVEAAEIMQNVETALYTNLNSRELEWGKAVEYGTVVDCIKNSDNRIQYVALDAIKYDSATCGGYEDFISPPDLTARNILKGNASWTQYSPFLYNYGDTEFTPEGTLPDTVQSIKTEIYVTSSSAQSYLVNDNEVFTILVPQYNSKVTYGNYLYVKITLAGENEPIPANTPYTLGSGEYLEFYTTREAAADNSGEEAGKGNADYTLGPGTIIRSSTKLEDTSKNTTEYPDGVLNMGSSVSIEQIERAQGTLSTTAQDGVIRIATNSTNLCEALGKLESGSDPSRTVSYTLLNDEYLFFTDSVGLELGIMTEGTTIYADSPTSGMKVLSSSSLTDLLKGTTTLAGGDSWYSINSKNKIHYSLNELYSFGANYLVKWSKESDEGNITTLKKDVMPSTFTDLTGATRVEYTLTTGENHSVSGSFSTLPGISEGDTYQYLARLPLVTGPGAPQLITSLKESASGTNNWPGTYQKVIISGSKEGGGSASASISGNSKNVSLQSSKLITYQGGNGLNLSSSESKDLQFYAYTAAANPVEYSISDTFCDVTQYGTGDSISVPNIEGTYSVIAYRDGSDSTEVKYLLAEAGTPVQCNNSDGATIGSVSKITMISRPYVTVASATYYNASSDKDDKGEGLDTLLNGQKAVQLTGNALYGISNYCPLYVPTDSEKLDDPTAAASYLLRQHPYNRYSIPCLSSIEGLVIDPAAISR